MLIRKLPVWTSAAAFLITLLISLSYRVGVLVLVKRLMAAYLLFYLLGLILQKVLMMDEPAVREKRTDGTAEEEADSAEDDEFIEYQPPVIQATDKKIPGRG